jgi:Rrf2 family protein
MNLSQKCQYALRALFELSVRVDDGPVSISDIAEAQAIPPRFLESILMQLKQHDWVKSFRGVRGGYQLAIDPSALSVGQVIRLVEGPLNPVKCIGGQGASHCPLQNRCAFRGLWDRAEQAIAGVYDATTFQQLVDSCQAQPEPYIPSYNI